VSADNDIFLHKPIITTELSLEAVRERLEQQTMSPDGLGIQLTQLVYFLSEGISIQAEQ
jgi:hypothetical protein